MRRYLEELGFHAFTFRGERGELERNLAKGRPLIVGLKKKARGGMHFAVVVGSDSEAVWLNDPTRKKAKRVKQAEFEKQWELAERWVLLATPGRRAAVVER
jgi:predicted double-glycine peptidase